jgi:phage terminase large subunit
MITATPPPPTKVFVNSYNAFEKRKRFIVNQGGSRSGKTYSIIQLLIFLCLNPNYKFSISIVSISFPHLRRGAMRDFMQIMDTIGLYDESAHNMTESVYTFPTGSYIEFFSADDSGKVRGPGRDILFINEANLFNEETFRQLNIRTKKVVFMDYNPADEFHWIYDNIIPQPETTFIKSTYLDNPFLPIEQIREIERLKSVDDNFWRVYGLGERGVTQETIYPNFDYYDTAPPVDYCFGLDFGFNHPNALVKCYYNDGKIWLEQCYYKSHVTTPELIDIVKPIVGQKFVYCDYSRPEIIEELRRAGINAYEANKNVKEGINWLRSNKVYIHRNSLDLQKEWRQYKWKTKPSGEVLDEPVKAFDDLADASRYAAISFKDSAQPTIMFYR